VLLGKVHCRFDSFTALGICRLLNRRPCLHDRLDLAVQLQDVDAISLKGKQEFAVKEKTQTVKKAIVKAKLTPVKRRRSPNPNTSQSAHEFGIGLALDEAAFNSFAGLQGGRFSFEVWYLSCFSERGPCVYG
jgi:hypothetical protein